MADEYILHLMSYPDLLVLKALSVTDLGTRLIFDFAFCDLAIPVDMCEMQTKTHI